jgi:hypothetical protein
MAAAEEPMIHSADDCVKALDNMDLTPDEVSRFGKAFKDPEFLQMFADYAKEISDPAAKAEQDAYLKQVEAEGRTKEVYGEVRGTCESRGRGRRVCGVAQTPAGCHACSDPSMESTTALSSRTAHVA